MRLTEHNGLGMNKSTLFEILLLVIFFTGFTQTQAAEPISASAESDIYADPNVWLCRPAHDELCKIPTEITQISANNAQSISVRKPASAPGIDCFYIYPTVSSAPAGNSGLIPGPDEKRVIANQFAPFASVCRPFAPMYRQITKAGLESTLGDKSIPIDPELAYSDILTAWRHYLRLDNHGRGVVLIGHSQGARLLARLIAEEIDGRPTQSLLLAAIIPGFNIEVPIGADIGGTFKHIPICRSIAQSGCVISYVSFRAETPPPPRTRFGRASEPNMQVACTDPTKLSGTPLDMALPTPIMNIESDNEWSTISKTIHTPFFAVPDMVHVQCVDDTHGNYLAVSMNPREKTDQRPLYIPGDLIVRGHLVYSWGLHLIDLNLVMGNLLAFVSQHDQGKDLGHGPQ